MEYVPTTTWSSTRPSWTNRDNNKVLKAHLLKGHDVSHTSWRPLSAS